MTYLPIIRRTIDGFAFAATFVSAVLWYLASKMHLDLHPSPAIGGLSPQAFQLFQLQVHLYSSAALATGVSAALQAVGLLLK